MTGWQQALTTRLGRGLAPLAVAALAMFAFWFVAMPLAPPTAASYLAKHPASRLAGPDFAIGGKPLACGKAQVLIDPGIDDLAHAYPGLIVLNGKYLPRLPDVVGLYAFGHECGHQLHGPDEAKADCYAVMRGEAQGWLDAKGIDTICDFWKPFAGDSQHLPGGQRCALMRRCFASAKAGKG